MVDELHALTQALPMKDVELDNCFGEIQAKATKEYATRCQDSGVPEDDATWEDHLSELARMLQDKRQIIDQENEKLILELVATVMNAYQDKLRAAVDALIQDDDVVNTDLAKYIEKHDEVSEGLAKEVQEEIKIASEK